MSTPNTDKLKKMKISTKTFKKHDPKVCSPVGKLTIIDDAKMSENLFATDILQLLKNEVFNKESLLPADLLKDPIVSVIIRNGDESINCSGSRKETL